MKTFLKTLAIILVINEIRGVVNVVVNGPRAVYAASQLDFRGAADIFIQMVFIVALGLAIRAIVTTVRDSAPSIQRVIEEANDA